MCVEGECVVVHIGGNQGTQSHSLVTYTLGTYTVPLPWLDTV